MMADLESTRVNEESVMVDIDSLDISEVVKPTKSEGYFNRAVHIQESQCQKTDEC